MLHTYAIPRDYLRATLCLAAKADVRYYLNGVLCQINAQGEGRLVATDGNVMGVLRFSALPDGAEQVNPVSIIIPRTVAETVKAAARGEDNYVTLELMADGKQWQMGDRLFYPLEGHFPDYQRVIPRKVSGIACQANPELISKFGAASKILGSKKLGACDVRIGWNGARNDRGERVDNGALIEIQGVPDFCGVLMPLRTNDADYPVAAPEWASVRFPAIEQACATLV